MGKAALIVGATGLIGKELLLYLLNAKEYDRVVAIVRSPLNIKHPKLQARVIHFEELDRHKEAFNQVDDVFCCLGTTIKKAKSQEAMKRIDLDYPILVGQMAKELGAKQYLVVSSLGANPNSSVWYAKMKGTLEEALKKLTYDSLHIFRPSLLLGQRNEFRLGERLAAFVYPVLSFFLIGGLRKYKAIPAKHVALSMYRAAQAPEKGTTIYLSDEISDMAKK
jgi:uncharacterized protein YbjT (DUF2867 family)